jgi:hypothetical protein
MFKVGLILFLTSLTLVIQASKLKQFDTDLCTFYREGTRSQPMLWANCCIKHDMAYWMAGARENRKNADLRLKSCVAKVAGDSQAQLMYRAVRLGRLSPIRSKWGWGWPWEKGLRKRYEPLTKEQRELAVQLIQEADVDPQLIEDFLSEIGKEIK